VKLFSYIYLLFLAPTRFGHAYALLQGVPQYKYQEYNGNHIKCITACLYLYCRMFMAINTPEMTRSYFTIFLHFKKKAAIIMDRIVEGFIVQFIISLVLLVFILWNTLKTDTGVAETCRC
jgi:hypothetical protein